MIFGGWAGITDRGLLRAANEDAWLGAPPLFVVADGMGGHAAGDVASALAVDAFRPLTDKVALEVQDVLDALAEANRAILAAAADPDRSGMGTTATGLALVQAGGSEHWLVFNVGDSRVYRLLDGDLTQLTVDHSEAEELVEAGHLTRAQAREYRRRNVVTRSLGTDPAPVPDCWVFPPAAGERFLICSDGLTTEVEDERIGACLVEEPDAEGGARRLVELALDAGGRDNVTVIVVDGLSTGSLSEVEEDTIPRGDRAG